MKQFFFIMALSILVSISSFSQIAVNNDGSLPHSSAMLQVKSNNKGMLIPQVNLTNITDVTTIPSPASSLMVYNTNAAITGGIGAGYYYWNGSKWIPLLSGNSGWSINGNSGTDTAVNFIGTVDAMALRFKMNNTHAGLIGQSITSFGFQSSTKGVDNTAIGHSSLRNNETGVSNTALGHRTLTVNSSGYNNTAIGKDALESNTSGNSNTANGVNALRANTIGIYNAAIGWEALRSNTSGNFNIAVGVNSLYGNTTGVNNTSVGMASLFSNSIGNGNTAFGNSALRFTNANTNSAFGNNALYSNATGYSNVAVGTDALYGNLNRSNLVAIGDSALFYNGTGATLSIHGSKNSATGSKALFSNTTGHSNTANGFEALYNSEGNYNTALGHYSMRQNSNGVHNTAVGSNSLQTNLTGDYNTAIGDSADVNDPAINNATAVGSHARVDQSNSMVLGSIAGVHGATASVKVGIGITTPTSMLHIRGNSGGSLVQLLLEENADDYTRLRFQKSVLAGEYWDIAGNTNATNANARLNFFYNGVGDILQIKGDGNATLMGTLTQLSDSRLKTNIIPVQSSLSQLLQLNGYRYNWKNNLRDNAVQIGLLAQEVKELFPELVSTNEKGMMSVNYIGMIPLLITALKEQQAEIQELKKKNERLTVLEKEVESIKQLLMK